MRRLALPLLLAALHFPAQAGAQDTSDEKLPKQALFKSLAEQVLVPLGAEFLNAATRLSAAADMDCIDRPARVQAAWRATQSAWQPLEMLQIGPALEHRTQRQVNAWPVRPTLLEPLLASDDPADTATAESLGAAGKGLPALEYLLFPADDATPKPAPEVRCRAVRALAGQVRAEAEKLAAGWRWPNGGFARELTEAGQHPQHGTFASADQALSDLVNLLIAGLDAIHIRKLGKPLEKSRDETSLERIESWRAGASLDHIRDNLRGFESAFFGAGQHGIGFDDYLAGIGRPVLPRLVRTDLDTAQKALAAIRPPLQRALTEQRPQVEALHKAIGQLRHRMESDIAEALKVDLGFNANDGD